MTLPPDLEPWIAELAPRLGLNDDEVPAQDILDIARDVAHDAVRPGAPVSAFMVGLALGRGDIASTDAGVQAVADALGAWRERGTSGGNEDAADATGIGATAEATPAPDAEPHDAKLRPDPAHDIVSGEVVETVSGDTTRQESPRRQRDGDDGDESTEESDAAGIVGDLDGEAS